MGALEVPKKDIYMIRKEWFSVAEHTSYQEKCSDSNELVKSLVVKLFKNYYYYIFNFLSSITQ